MRTIRDFINVPLLVILGAGLPLAANAADNKTDPNEKPASYYLYYGDKIKLLPLADKGYSKEKLKLHKTGFTFPRPCPEAAFDASVKSTGKTGLKYEKVQFEILEESGVERNASVRFGFPLPVSGLFDLSKIRIIDAGGKVVDSQISATVFWKDSSIKWVLVQFSAPLKAGERKVYNVEFGENVTATSVKSPLNAQVRENEIIVDTGVMRVLIDKKKFNILKDVKVDKNHDGKYGNDETVASFEGTGVELLDENKNLYASAFGTPSEWIIEESGPEKIVIRAKGEYAAKDNSKKIMSYQARIAFTKNSPAVTVSWTHINTSIDNEFTDINSINMKMVSAGKIKKIEALADDGKVLTSDVSDTAPAVFNQWDDLTLSVNGRDIQNKLSGAAQLTFDNGSKTGLIVRKCWQRWPKSFAADKTAFTIGLLPEQPSKEFGRNLPFYLQFPFCEGKYRMKWGMAFTEDITFDFSGNLSMKQMDAEANLPVVAVIPAAWYARTDALSGKIPAPNGKQFSLWFNAVEKAFYAHMEMKKEQREYGFFNYGDSFGERSRNWTNNEYDFAHGLFMNFICTGNRDQYRWAMETASHQADVDTVHAYPDPWYIGSNHQHSIGHTGNWSQHHIRAEWTHLYDSHTSADNGHTWLNGLVDAWALGGNVRSMNSAYKTAEHITWAMAPDFKRLGSHERSAGWPLLAISAAYNLTGDKEYLKAASKIASVTIGEQKFNDGGAWPHILPKDHAGGSATSVGNCAFLIGIVLNGMSAYYAASGDQDAVKSLKYGTNWLAKSFDYSKAGWPYSATKEGKALLPGAPGLNNIILPSLSYFGALENDKEKMKIVELAFTGKYMSGPGVNGKSLAFSIQFACDIMSGIQKYSMANYPDKGESFMADETGIVNFMKNLDTRSEINNRSPGNKIISIVLTKENATVKCHARPHGAKPLEKEKGDLKIVPLNSDKSVKTDLFDAKKAFDGEYQLTGKVGDVFNIMITDDQSLVWCFDTDGAECFAKVVPGFSIGAVGISKYFFTVPRDAKSFKLEVEGLHEGEYGAALFKPDGSIAGIKTGSNNAVNLPWSAQAVKGKKEQVVFLEKVSQTSDSTWFVILWGAGDMSVKLNGIPPYISTTNTVLPKSLLSSK